MNTEFSSNVSEFFELLKSVKPFSLLPTSNLELWLEKASLRNYGPGQRILRPDEVNSHVYFVVDGKVRVLSHQEQSSKTLAIKEKYSLLGWISLLRAEPTELIQAKTPTTVLCLRSDLFISFYKNCAEFSSYFDSHPSESEISVIFESVRDKCLIDSSAGDINIPNTLTSSKVYVFRNTSDISRLISDPNYSGTPIYMSSSGVKEFPVGSVLSSDVSTLETNLLLPIRAVSFDPDTSKLISDNYNDKAVNKSNEELPELSDYHQLGIIEDEKVADSDRYPSEKGSGPLNEAIAICHTVSLHQRVPFRFDTVQKIVESRLLRNKSISLRVYAALFEILGMKCQLAETSKLFLPSIESPAIFFYEDKPIVFFEIKNEPVKYSHPQNCLQKTHLSEFMSQLDEKINFILPRRVSSPQTSRFSWSWFVPLLKKYKKSLLIVFASSLLAQLFGLAIPLLIQQIIDKVLSQGNLSSLNVLGTTMIVLALFQGLLQVLRTYIFVDTTDRMDLALGTSVIDRLLSLPLSFFEKRPVGELSQRLGELNAIRGFLTGTALISVLISIAHYT